MYVLNRNQLVCMIEKNRTTENFIERILKSRLALVLFLLAAAGSMLLLAAVQPFGDPPDEINRFKVVYYIANHGSLPNGFDEEVILGGYGGSYAFQPILSYILMGWLLRFLKLFTMDSFVLILAARLVNVVFGVVMAYYVWAIGRKLWREVSMQWLFTLMIVFLPMNLFMHSYVNTDSMALLSCAMIVYSMLCGEEDDYRPKTCIRMAIGVIFCAMSYYNAYGIVLCAILFFVFHFARKKAWKEMFTKGGLITLIAFAGAGWWFIRNGILYGGDILGMNARTECAIQTALPELNPLTRFTFYSAGLPISAVFAEKQYAWVTFESMIAMFGPMNIPTHGLIYLYYKRLVIVACIGALLPIISKQPLFWEILGGKNISARQMPLNDADGRIIWKWKLTPRLCFGLLMLLDCLITMGLHLYYSYTWEYQPQGRYLLPMVISAGYILCMGIWKICQGMEILAVKCVRKKDPLPYVKYMQTALIWLVMLFVMLTFVYTIFRKVIPAYWHVNDLSGLRGVPYEQLVDLFFGRM